ncbi:DUF4145 domain-containing protein [Neobacillus niacini]|uniref:DUF4145 domain-containing protein n=1 Tax=Neobacillus niacini TaxID=86668 RepID=UPI0021CB15A0|nr:DUF4145 domain-containing protein [Neobacillus niacini]MCM3768391.1 DUF4145 domain-containing protein [Neobacillus niacini]
MKTEKKVKKKELIKQKDRDERGGRAKRLKFINEFYDTDKMRIVLGTSFTGYILEEAVNSFIYGNYIATVMMTQSVIEQTLKFNLQTESDMSFFDTINSCYEAEKISEEQKDAFHKLREIRNSYTHQPKYKRFENISEIDDLLLEDAKFALKTLFLFNY